MSPTKSSSAAQLQQLIEYSKAVRPVSPAARSRVLKRAQSSALAGAAFGISSLSVPPKSTWSRGWLGGAASAILLAGAAALAFHGRKEAAPARDRAALGGALVVPSAVFAPVPVTSSFAPEPKLSPPTLPTAQPPAARQPPRAPESYAGELELLRRAHAAYGNGDFSNALRLLAEHGRRFPNGRLAEEREALRVRALSGSGQSDSARRAAHAFADRFPRSVLLSRTMAAADAGE